MGYPDHLHDEHSDYALLPENRKVKPQMLSKHQRKLAEEYNINVDANSRAPKLICSLYDKVSIPHPPSPSLPLSYNSHLILLGEICTSYKTITAGNTLWNGTEEGSSCSLIYTILLA